MKEIYSDYLDRMISLENVHYEVEYLRQRDVKDYINNGFTVDLDGQDLSYYTTDDETIIVLVDDTNKVIHLIDNNCGDYLENAICFHNSEVEKGLIQNGSVSNKKQNNIYLIDF